MIGVIHYAYGAPTSVDDVPAYFSHILGGKPVPPPMLKKIVAQFKQPGYADFIASNTQRIAKGLTTLLNDRFEEEVKVYTAYKHTVPYIPTTVEQALADGCTTIVTLPINPIFSATGAGAFHEEVAQLLEGKDVELVQVKDWNTHEDIVNVYADRVSRAYNWLSADVREDAYVFFTVHSQPINPEGNVPYVPQYEALAAAIAEKAGIANYAATYRSSGGKANWLAPDVKDAIREKFEQGSRAFVTCELLSLSADVESFIEIGSECQEVCKELGADFVLAEFPGDSFDTVYALANIAEQYIKQAVTV